MNTPATQIIDAIALLNAACDELGIARPTIIGLRTMVAVNAVEAAMSAEGKGDLVRQVTGGIEINGVAFKVRQS